MRPPVHALLLGMGLTLAACSFETPEAPVWETTINVPLISKTYTMQEILEEQSELYADSGGLVHYLYETDISPFTVGDQLTLAGFNETFESKLGEFTVSTKETVNTDVAFQELLPEARDFGNAEVPVPQFEFDLPAKSFPLAQDFEWAEVSSGQLELVLNNDLPVAISPNVRIRLLDMNNGTTISEVTHPSEIPPGEELRKPIDLSGRRFSNNLGFTLLGGSPGSRGLRHRVRPDAGLDVRVEMSDLRVQSASAKLPSQFVRDNQSTVIRDEIVVSQALVKAGVVVILASGSFPVDAMLKLNLPDFVRADGAPYADSLYLPSSSNASMQLDFAGATFAPQSPGFDEQQIRFQWELRTQSTGDRFVTFRDTDFMRVEFGGSEMRFSEVSGALNQKRIDLTSETIELEMPADLDGIEFEDVRMNLTVENGIRFPSQLHLRLDGYNQSGQHNQISIDAPISAALQSGELSESKIGTSAITGSLAEFLNILPERVEVSGYAVVGQSGYVGTITERDEVKAQVQFEAPLRFKLPAQQIESEATEVDISDDLRRDIDERFLLGSVSTEVGNHLPVGASVSLYFGNSDSTLFSQPIFTLGPLGADAPAIDPQSGLVQTTQSTDTVLELTPEQIDAFQTEPLFVGFVLDLPGTGVNKVNLTREDFIGVKALAAMKLRVEAD